MTDKKQRAGELQTYSPFIHDPELRMIPDAVGEYVLATDARDIITELETRVQELERQNKALDRVSDHHCELSTTWGIMYYDLIDKYNTRRAAVEKGIADQEGILERMKINEEEQRRTHRERKLHEYAYAVLKTLLNDNESGEPTAPDITKCPQCSGPADNGFDRCLPPSPYYCKKCQAKDDRPAALAGARMRRDNDDWYLVSYGGPTIINGELSIVALSAICRHYKQTHDVKEGEYTVVECDTCRRTDTGKPGGRVIYHLTREECDNWQNFPLKSIKCPNCNGTGHTLEYVEQEKGE